MKPAFKSNWRAQLISSWLIATKVAFCIALFLTLLFTGWDWLANPSGIFHDDTGTNWRFVYDTAESWFLPAFFSSFVTIALIHFLLQRFGFFKKN
ncbi:MAG: hypothetical protein RKH07_05840 [Gammaproteobacteria bacterium]